MPPPLLLLMLRLLLLHTEVGLFLGFCRLRLDEAGLEQEFWQDPAGGARYDWLACLFSIGMQVGSLLQLIHER